TVYFFFSSRRRHTRFSRDWSSDVCSSDLAKTHATGAVNAALHAVGGDEQAHALGHHHTLFFLIARSGLAVAHGQILQLALAALVTDRAVQRVIDQQKFHHRVLRGNRLFRARVNDHAVGNGRGTGGQGLGRLLDVDQAHT